MQYKPHRTVKQTAVIGIVLIAITVVFVAMANLGLGFLWLNQLGSIACITALIYLLIRYVMTDFVYQLPEEENRLSVKKINSRLPRTVAEIPLSPADRIIPYDKDARRREGIAQIENYCVSLFPEESWLLITRIDGKKVALRLECREDVVRLIRARIEALPDKEEEE